MKTVKIEGMRCNHCRDSVLKALQALPGSGDVEVDLAEGKATIAEQAPVSADAIRQAIEKIGFQVLDVNG